MQNQSLYPISTISELTGIKAMTLRAWERRYALLNPERTEKGRRLYSKSDLEKIHAVKILLAAGVPISRAAETINNGEPVKQEKIESPNNWQQYITAIKKSIENFDEDELDATYHEVSSLYPVDMVTEKLILPLLKLLGEDWEKNNIGVAEEHFFSAYLRNKLGARFHTQNRFTVGDPIIVAGLPGDNHEFGLLLFSLTLLNSGIKVLLLGPNLPLNDLEAMIHKVHPSTIVLAGSRNMEAEQIAIELKTIQDRKKIKIFVGGPISVIHYNTFIRNGICPLTGNFIDSVREIETYQKHAKSEEN